MERYYKLKRLTLGAGYLTVPALMEKKITKLWKKKIECIKLEELGDYNGSIDNLIKILKKYKKEYGGNTNIEFDAGHNNIDVFLFF